jgi:hypothetical protein
VAEKPADPLRGFRERIRHPNLVRLYDYWAERQRGRSFPSRQDIDPVELRFALGNMTLVDVLHDPLRFRFRLVGSLMAQRMGHDYTGKMVDDVEDTGYRDSLIAAYKKIVETRGPSTILYEREIDGKTRRFEVLRLPLAADGETINMLLLCPQYFDPLPERPPLAKADMRGPMSPRIISEDYSRKDG